MRRDSTDLLVTRCSTVGLSGLEPLTSALSERLGLARLSLGRPESPLVSVGKPCAVLHSFVVLPKLVSPARPLPLPPAAACGLW